MNIRYFIKPSNIDELANTAQLLHAERVRSLDIVDAYAKSDNMSDIAIMTIINELIGNSPSVIESIIDEYFSEDVQDAVFDKIVNNGSYYMTVRDSDTIVNILETQLQYINNTDFT